LKKPRLETFPLRRNPEEVELVQVVVAPQGDPRNPLPPGSKEGWLPWVSLSRKRQLIGVSLVVEPGISQKIVLSKAAVPQLRHKASPCRSPSVEGQLQPIGSRAVMLLI